MGKVGRIACIATPMVLTFVSLILLVVVLLAGWNKNDGNLTSLHFFRANTTNFKQNATLSGFESQLASLDPKVATLISNLLSANRKAGIADIYDVYLWNYCSGNATSSGAVKLDYCSPRQARYWFNPIQVWGLNGTGVTNFIPGDLQKGLNIYKGVSQWMFVAYAVAFFATLANLVVGLLAICSRWGSCCTTIVAIVATVFTFLAALTSTILFSVLAGLFNSVLKTYGIHISIGTKMFSVDWAAVAVSLAATLFWTVSICCCSGRGDDRGSRRRAGPAAAGGGPLGRAEYAAAVPFGSRGYQPLGGEHGLPQDQHQHQHQRFTNVEMSSFGANTPYKGRETAYEPFRHA